jgi:hypothetical protein
MFVRRSSIEVETLQVKGRCISLFKIAASLALDPDPYLMALSDPVNLVRCT